MTKFGILAVPIWIMSALCVVSAQASAAASHNRWVPGRILVEPHPGVEKADFESLLRGKGARSKGRIGSLRVHVVEVPERAEDAVAAALAHNPRIKFAEKDLLLAPTATSANDENYSSAWHLAAIQAPDAWDSSRGAGVTVAVLDTGVDGSHPDLQGQLVPGWNTYDNNADTSPLCGHGTSVAGIVAAASNNTIGVTSIGWDSRIMPMRVTRSDCWASASAVAAGLSWAADHGARVANISFEGVSSSSTVRTAAEYMRSRGGVVFAAAGNGGTASSIPPTTSILIVSATDPNDMLRSFSDYGTFVDFAAPGGGIWTTNSGGGYGTFGGTSSSTPVAAGVAALVLGANPSLTPDEVENVLAASSVDLGVPGKDSYFGYGRVDAAAAVAAALSGAPPGDDGSDPADTVAPVADAGGPYTGTAGVAVSFDGSGSSDSDGSIVTYTWNFGDGSSGSGVTNTHTYDNAGTYTVTLTVTDNAAMNDSATTSATISAANGAPAADANGPYTGTAGVAVSFDGSGSTDSDGSIVNYAWDFGDGSSGSGVDSPHIYDKAGTYTVTLTVTDNAGGTDVATTWATMIPSDLSQAAVFASTLPSSRSVQVGNPATVFATIINASATDAIGCSIAPHTSVPANFDYQITSASNVPTGTPNMPVDIAAGDNQSFILAFTPTAAMAPTDVVLGYECANSNPAPVTEGLNTVLLSASTAPVPDVVALAATPTGDGIVNLPGTNGSNAFAVSAVNVGSTATITASAAPSVTLPLVLSICETNPATGACLSAPASSTTSSVSGDATPTYSVFVTGNGTVPFDPATNRIIVDFKDAGGVVRGSTSVAVRTL